MISTVILDLDGTIFDSEAVLTKVFQSVLIEYELISKEETDLKWMIGPHFGDVLSQLRVKEANHLEIFEKVANQLLPLTEEYQIFEGMKSVVEKISTKYETFVATAKPLNQANKLLDQFGMSKWFVDVYGDDINEFVSKSEMVNRIKQNRNSSDSLVLIGDSENDITAALNNEIYSIFVTWGYGVLDPESDSQPHDTADFPEILIERIEALV